MSDTVLDPPGQRPRWHDKARCQGKNFDPTDFFLEGIYAKGSAPYVKARDRAMAVCAMCPVSAECLKYALDGDIRDGIWGGLTGSARRQILYPKQRASDRILEAS